MTFKDFMTDTLLITAFPIVILAAFKLSTLADTTKDTCSRASATLDTFNGKLKKVDPIIKNADIFAKRVAGSTQLMANAIDELVKDGKLEEAIATLARAGRILRK